MKLYVFPSSLKSHYFSDRENEFSEFQVFFPLNWTQIVNARAGPPEAKERPKLPSQYNITILYWL